MACRNDDKGAQKILCKMLCQILRHQWVRDIGAADMPFQWARSKARDPQIGPLSGPEQAAGGLDHRLQAGGDLEIAQAVRREPPEIVKFVVEDRLPRAPRRRERD